MKKVAFKIILAHIMIGIIALLTETYIFRINSIANPKSFDKILFTASFMLIYLMVGYLLSRSYSMKKVLKTSLILLILEIIFIFTVAIGVKFTAGILTENLLFLLLISMFYNYNTVNIVSSIDIGISLYGAIPVAAGAFLNYSFIIIGSFIEYRAVSRTKLLNRLNNL